MPNNTKKSKVEVLIADKLAKFVDVFRGGYTQQQVHDAIYTLENDIPTPEQVQLINKLLNASLSLSFLLIGSEDAVDKFIEYHNE